MIVSDQVIPAALNVSSVVLNDSNTKSNVPANIELCSMEAKRIAWETGVYRTSDRAFLQLLA